MTSTKHGFAALSKRLRYVAGDYRDADTFRKLRSTLGEARAPLHYLAIPPSLFGEVVAQLGASGCARGARVVVEKPLGRDLESAQALEPIALAKVFDESQIFRIDHFLGKEPVQNLLYFRFANAFLEPLWNREHVAKCATNDGGVLRHRGPWSPVRRTGRDTRCRSEPLVAGREPAARWNRRASFTSDALRDEKVEGAAGCAIARGAEHRTRPVCGLPERDGRRHELPRRNLCRVAARHRFPRWAGVPFLIRAGKRLPVTATQVMVRLRAPSHPLFDATRNAPESRALSSWAGSSLDRAGRAHQGVRRGDARPRQ